MKYAVIDIGTNSVRYMLADYCNGNIQLISTHKNTTRLGEGLYTAERRLCEKPVFDTVCAVKKFTELATKSNADIILCTATSAVRDSSNSEEFRAKIRQEAGIELRILSGEEEALAGFIGALGNEFDIQDTAVVDIGGGSTEVISSSNNNIVGTSFECGCVRLRELFGSDYSSANEYISKTVIPPVCKNIVWIGGTATAAAMIFRNMKEYSPADVHMTRLSVEFLSCLKDTVVNTSPEKLKQLCAFDPKRAELLPFGLMIISHITSKTNSRIVTVSEKGLMDGLIRLHADKKLQF